jgi:hypothetical protein
MLVNIMDKIEKKLREAQFCLAKMREQERRAFGDKEQFDHSLSAFLSAAMSLRDAFHVEQDRKRDRDIKAWKKTWEGHLTPEHERIIYDFMCEDRNAEVHRSGTRRIVRTKEIKIGVGGSYSDSSGILSVMGSPGLLIGSDTAATIHMPQYVFNIAGTERPVTEVCAEYLELLRQMVAQYKESEAKT